MIKIWSHIIYDSIFLISHDRTVPASTNQKAPILCRCVAVTNRSAPKMKMRFNVKMGWNISIVVPVTQFAVQTRIATLVLLAVVIARKVLYSRRLEMKRVVYQRQNADVFSKINTKNLDLRWLSQTAKFAFVRKEN